jgi:hypothetical protein
LQLDVTAEDAAILVDVLDSALAELREEIYKAEIAEYKSGLKQREAALARLLAQARTAVG